jgi:adenine-specific DNA-methyltransferase
MSVERQIDGLVSRTRAAAGKRDVRAAFADVLATLRIPPEEAEAWRDGTDIVGAAYERLLSPGARRLHGQFFTPFWAGEVMAGWLFSEPRRLVLDPGCGAGGLLIPAARHERRGNARLLGIDCDKLAITMARRNRALREITGLNLKVANFLTDPLGARPDAIACNPPYAKHQTLDADVKSALYGSFERRLKLALSRRTPLQVLFLVRALECCAADGAMAFITPTGWLDADYGAPVKRFLLERAHVDARIVFEAKHLFFPGARTTAEISLIRNAPSSEPTKVIRLPRNLPAVDEVIAALEGEGNLRVSTQRLDPTRGWSRPSHRRRGEKLGHLARVRRGIATGCNRFFVVSEQQRRELALPRAQVKPCITSPRLVATDELKPSALAALPMDVPRWAINCYDPAEEAAATPLGNYLRSELAQIARETHLAKQRQLWYGLERRDESPILFTYFNKNRPRFVRNRAGALPLNTWLIVEPNDGVDADDLWARLLTLTREQIAYGARVYGAGLWKLEPSELAELVIAPVGRG